MILMVSCQSLHSLAEDMGLALGQTGYQAIASGCARLSEGKLLADMRVGKPGLSSSL